ncbi:uncharacterized protein FIBRA_08860 [Fibroporia radiculosa]|uniref:Retrotransposon Copia-like N-terminal domain-containing protein n=1 Tax=Fibroporia radiculosa TaxID=599839 RepID=J4I3F5_9APHY|nr:uncharacterized protein FIBRA_08860 [Fibroporia radiculosa]CCM06582.1 predicted protein [Fibroporia radiculosa]
MSTATPTAPPPQPAPATDVHTDHRSPISVSSLSQVEKLTGALNYKAWADNVQSILMMYDYWPIVKGTELRPGNDDRVGQRVWDRNDDRIIGFIRLLVSSTIRYSLTSLNTSKRIWSSLESSYGSAGDFNDFLAFKSLT